MGQAYNCIKRCCRYEIQWGGDVEGNEIRNVLDSIAGQFGAGAGWLLPTVHRHGQRVEEREWGMGKQMQVKVALRK